MPAWKFCTRHRFIASDPWPQPLSFGGAPGKQTCTIRCLRPQKNVCLRWFRLAVWVLHGRVSRRARNAEGVPGFHGFCGRTAMLHGRDRRDGGEAIVAATTESHANTSPCPGYADR
ncbi:hypothetical protein MRX96_019581 [Rhipicephalus microplus]